MKTTVNLNLAINKIAAEIFENSKSVYYNKPNTKDLAWALSIAYDTSAEYIEDKINAAYAEEMDNDKYKVSKDRLQLLRQGLKDIKFDGNVGIQTNEELAQAIFHVCNMNFGYIKYWPKNRENNLTHEKIHEAIVDYVVETNFPIADVLSAFKYECYKGLK